jgi:hypothetical protein
MYELNFGTGSRNKNKKGGRGKTRSRKRGGSKKRGGKKKKSYIDLTNTKQFLNNNNQFFYSI